MTNALSSYLRDQVWLRRRELLFSSQLVLAFVVGGASALWGSDSPLAAVKLGDLVPVVLAYAALVFAFALAGLTITVTLPDADFSQTLIFTELPADGQPGFLGTRRRTRRRMHARAQPPNPYLDLLFVFSWTAFVHWALLVATIAAVIVAGPNHALLPSETRVMCHVGVGLLALLVTYGLLQFLVALLTLSAVGTTYVTQRRRRPKAESEQESKEASSS